MSGSRELSGAFDMMGVSMTKPEIEVWIQQHDASFDGALHLKSHQGNFYLESVE